MMCKMCEHYSIVMPIFRQCILGYCYIETFLNTSFYWIYGVRNIVSEFTSGKPQDIIVFMGALENAMPKMIG